MYLFWVLSDEGKGFVFNRIEHSSFVYHIFTKNKFGFFEMSFSSDLLMWYDKNYRKLPWRETKNPYHIWLSEIILQQTRVEQGLPYYYKFTETFKDVFALAYAKEEQVLKLWQGLGYYSRGRNLHAAAKIIAIDYSGNFPQTFDAIKKLKGIGDYTAAAIASFAFNKPHAVVDGNVYRVLSRLFLIKTPVNSTEGKKIFAATADELLDKKNPAKFNQAIMELGALVCKPANPDCTNCPVRNYCKAFEKKAQSSVPVKLKKLKVKNRFLNYFVLKDGKYIYIKQRTAKDIWQGLFDFPVVDADHIFESVAEQKREAKKISGTEKIAIEKVTKPFKHQLTHQNIQAVFMEVLCKPSAKIVKKNNWIKIKPHNLHDYALPRLIDKFLKEEFKKD